jgi:hypothetical protein
MGRGQLKYTRRGRGRGGGGGRGRGRASYDQDHVDASTSGTSTAVRAQPLPKEEQEEDWSERDELDMFDQGRVIAKGEDRFQLPLEREDYTGLQEDALEINGHDLAHTLSTVPLHVLLGLPPEYCQWYSASPAAPIVDTEPEPEPMPAASSLDTSDAAIDALLSLGI